MMLKSRRHAIKTCMHAIMHEASIHDLTKEEIAYALSAATISFFDKYPEYISILSRVIEISMLDEKEARP
jgi:hypothetical protein